MGLHLLLLGIAALVCVAKSARNRCPDAHLADLFECDEDGFICRKAETKTAVARSKVSDWLSIAQKKLHMFLNDFSSPNDESLMAMGVLCLFVLSFMYSWQGTWRSVGVPGPTAYTLFGNNLEIMWRGGLKRSIQQWSDEYGKVFGIHLGTQPVLVVSDVNIVTDILQNRTGSFSDRPVLSAWLLESPLRHSVFVCQGREWEVLRHLLSSAFKPNNLKYMVYRLSRCSNNLAEYVEDLAIADSQAINMKECVLQFCRDFNILITSYVYDSLVAVLLGLDLDHRDNDTHEYFCVVADVLKSIHTECAGFCVPSRLNELVNYFKAAIRERKCCKDNAHHGRLDFLGILLQSGHAHLIDPVSIPSFELDEQSILGAMITWVLHGHPTLVSALQFAVHMMAQNPQHQEACYNEIDSILGTDDPDETSLLRMEFLDLFIRETLRMLPPVQEIWRTARSTSVVQGVTIPAGVSILVPVSMVHEDERNFLRAFTFRPERYHISDASRGKKSPGLNLAFGGGPRVCMGLWITTLQMKIMLIYLLRRVKFCPAPPDAPPLSTDIMAAGLAVTDEGGIMRPRRPFKVCAVPRHPQTVIASQSQVDRMPVPMPDSEADTAELDREMLGSSDEVENDAVYSAFKTRKMFSLWEPDQGAATSSGSALSMGSSRSGAAKDRYGVNVSGSSPVSSHSSVSGRPAFPQHPHLLKQKPKSSKSTSSEFQRPMRAYKAKPTSSKSQSSVSSSSRMVRSCMSDELLGQQERDLLSDAEEKVSLLLGPPHAKNPSPETLTYGGEFVIVTPPSESYRPMSHADTGAGGGPGMSTQQQYPGKERTVRWLREKGTPATQHEPFALSSVMDHVRQSCPTSHSEFDFSATRGLMESAFTALEDAEAERENRLQHRKHMMETAAHLIVKAALDEAADEQRAAVFETKNRNGNRLAAHPTAVPSQSSGADMFLTPLRRSDKRKGEKPHTKFMRSINFDTVPAPASDLPRRMSQLADEWHNKADRHLTPHLCYHDSAMSLTPGLRPVQSGTYIRGSDSDGYNNSVRFGSKECLSDDASVPSGRECLRSQPNVHAGGSRRESMGMFFMKPLVGVISPSTRLLLAPPTTSLKSDDSSRDHDKDWVLERRSSLSDTESQLDALFSPAGGLDSVSEASKQESEVPNLRPGERENPEERAHEIADTTSGPAVGTPSTTEEVPQGETSKLTQAKAGGLTPNSPPEDLVISATASGSSVDDNKGREKVSDVLTDKQRSDKEKAAKKNETSKQKNTTGVEESGAAPRTDLKLLGENQDEDKSARSGKQRAKLKKAGKKKEDQRTKDNKDPSQVAAQHKKPPVGRIGGVESKETGNPIDSSSALGVGVEDTVVNSPDNFSKCQNMPESPVVSNREESTWTPEQEQTSHAPDMANSEQPAIPTTSLKYGQKSDSVGPKILRDTRDEAGQSSSSSASVSDDSSEGSSKQGTAGMDDEEADSTVSLLSLFMEALPRCLLPLVATQPSSPPPPRQKLVIPDIVLTRPHGLETDEGILVFDSQFPRTDVELCDESSERGTIVKLKEFKLTRKKNPLFRPQRKDIPECLLVQKTSPYSLSVPKAQARPVKRSKARSSKRTGRRATPRFSVTPVQELFSLVGRGADYLRDGMWSDTSSELSELSRSSGASDVEESQKSGHTSKYLTQTGESKPEATRTMNKETKQITAGAPENTKPAVEIRTQTNNIGESPDIKSAVGRDAKTEERKQHAASSPERKAEDTARPIDNSSASDEEVEKVVQVESNAKEQKQSNEPKKRTKGSPKTKSEAKESKKPENPQKRTLESPEKESKGKKQKKTKEQKKEKDRQTVDSQIEQSEMGKRKKIKSSKAEKHKKSKDSKAGKHTGSKKRDKETAEAESKSLKESKDRKERTRKKTEQAKDDPVPEQKEKPSKKFFTTKISFGPSTSKPDSSRSRSLTSPRLGSLAGVPGNPGFMRTICEDGVVRRKRVEDPYS